LSQQDAIVQAIEEYLEAMRRRENEQEANES